LKLLLSAKLLPLTTATLFVLGHDLKGMVRCVRATVPVYPSAVKLVDCSICEPIRVAQYDGDAFAGEFAIPLDVFSPAHAIFVKLERRSWFFDEAGWLETRPVTVDNALPRMTSTGWVTTEASS
jgi:hypothetical protein